MASRSRERSSSDGSDAAERLHRHRMTKPESNTATSCRRCLFDNVAPPVLLSAASWLPIRDLLALGTVDRSFRDLTKDDMLWKLAAVFLFRSALVDGQSSLVEGVSVGLHKDAPGNLTLQDICRCMVGAWPTHIDRHWRADELLQASIGGVLQPLQAGAASGGVSGSDADPENAQRADTALAAGLCDGVVFRGGLGGDRAVRANVPFPWAGCGRTRSQRPRGADMSRGSSLVKMELTTYDRPVYVHYPDVVLARVKASAPFALLWPGHAAAAAAAGRKGEGGSGEDGRGGNVGHGGLVDENEKVRLKVERLPSSGPAPFFHAGYTAYFEITLGKTMEPLEQPRDEDFHLEQCVAIGLAHDNFPLEDKQPGWDRNSWGLHSDDGCFHHRGAIALSATADPTTFGPGDTVGCGLLYPRGLAHYEHWLSGRGGALPTAGENDSGGSKGAIFFTKNGRYLGMASRRVNVKRPLYPCVGLDSHCCVAVNFGAKPFAFDVPAFEALFTGAALGSAPPVRERRCHTDDIKKVYSGRNGFTNPRVLCPHLRLQPPVDEERQNDARVPKTTRNVPKGVGVLASESELLRRSLKSIRFYSPHVNLLSVESDNSGNSSDDSWLMSEEEYTNIEEWEEEEEEEEEE